MDKHAAFIPGNVAVITGAAEGIGFAAAKCYAGYGMHVLLADIDEHKLVAAAAAVHNIGAPLGGRVASRQLDVANYADIEALKEQAYATFGRVDVLMNNAGTSRATGSWTDREDWRHLLEVNLWGVIHGVQAFTAAMIAQQSPALIINTGSKQGITNPPGNPAYNVSKAAVNATTEALQHSLRNTPACLVSAHLLVPGYTFTGLTQRRVQDKPAAAWWPEQVVEYMLAALARGSFYIICPDNEVTTAEDVRRMLWAAGDLAFDRSALSRWDPTYQAAFRRFTV